MRRVLIEDRPPASGSTQKHRSPSDLRRDQERAEAHGLEVAAKRNAEAQAEVRTDRVDAGARTGDVNPFMAGSLDRRQRVLDAAKLSLRGEVRLAPTTDVVGAALELGMESLAPEGSSYNGRVSMRGTRS